ncbi:MAG: hypothetical protein EXR76_04415 [Myxococcales bacterium]|nr:hypothetical protein [Myxococcales bacterium]
MRCVISWGLVLGVSPLFCPLRAFASGGGPVVNPDESLARLKDGNARFIAGRSKHENNTPKRRAEVAHGQHPFAVVVTCSDSRLAPELLFDMGIGEVFVVRTAGQAMGDFEMASIEYAIEHLGASLVLIVGHERCGAVRATVEALFPEAPGPSPAHRVEHSPEAAHGNAAHGDAAHGDAAHGDAAHGDGHRATSSDKTAFSQPPRSKGHGRGHVGDDDTVPPDARDHIHTLVAAITPAVLEVVHRVPRAELLDAAIDSNSRNLVRRLIRESPMIKSYLVSGRVRLLAARYDLDTGKVEVLR